MMAADFGCASFIRSTQMYTALAEAVSTAQAATATNVMDTTSMLDMMLVIMYIGCGFYCIYSYLIQRKQKVLHSNKMICPGNRDSKTCAKPQEFLRFILPRTLILGIALVLFGALFILDHLFGGGNPWLTIGLTFLPLMFFVWYVLEQRKAVKLFW